MSTKVHGAGGQYDLVHDLMPLKMGVGIIKNDSVGNEGFKGKTYGVLPLMASSSEGEIGALWPRASACGS